MHFSILQFPPFTALTNNEFFIQAFGHGGVSTNLGTALKEVFSMLKLIILSAFQY